MIVGGVSAIYDVAAFTERLAEAARGLVRLVSGDDGVGTGWLITPELVVVPGYLLGAAARGAPLQCDVPGDGRIGFRVEHAPADAARSGQTPALLRLDRPAAAARPLQLELASRPDGDGVVLLQHPGGRPETRFSFGRLGRAVEGGMRGHDADTEPGSGGGPVLAPPGMGLVAMHIGRAPDSRGNYALPLHVLLDELRAAPAWPQIADRHRLADVAVARAAPSAPTEPGGPDEIEPGEIEPGETERGAGAPPSWLAARVTARTRAALRRAAMRWRLDPTQLDEGARTALAPLVVDPDDDEWSMALPERQRLLRDAGLRVLRELRAAEPVDEPGAAVVDRILAGPPYDLDAEPEDVLPHWLQAVRWFEELIPQLPAAATVHRALERRRIRSRLAVVAGPGFRGRETELAVLRTWFAGERPGPMVVSGIGGIGKSALVARFAERLPPVTPLLWLDFDRPDIAPDDAVSLLAALAAQATLQLDGFAAPDPFTDPATGSVTDPTPEQAARAAGGFGAALTAAAPGAVLLVLDGFEIAQHRARYQEIWPVLDALLASAPRLRVLVSGRAPVTDLLLAGRPAASLQLTGLDPAMASAWLVERGVTDPADLARVVAVARGIPLVLKLAMRLAAAGGDLAELPERMVEGYLYTRILDRVVDPRLRPLARDVLVLRAVHAQMLADVLPDRLPDGLDPAAVLAALTRELALVEDLDDPEAPPGSLRMRPEVRAAVLRLLTVADADRVREIDRRAADWLAARVTGEPGDAAELVYHRLRLADVPGAASAWRAGCAERLADAVDELPDPAARAWLRERLAAVAPAAELAAWERDAAERARAANRRGLTRALDLLLGERDERSRDSPLLVFDAWSRWQHGDLTGAAALLDAAAPVAGPVGRDRALVRAGIAVAAGDPGTADRLLSGLQDERQWAGRPGGDLGVLAARVRLTVDLAAELALTTTVPAGRWTGEIPDDGLLAALGRLVAPSDVLLPSLRENLYTPDVEISQPVVPLPTGPAELPGFAAAVADQRTREREWVAARSGPAGSGPASSDSASSGPAGSDSAGSGSAGSDSAGGSSAAGATLHERAVDLAGRLGAAGERRWLLGTTTRLLTVVPDLLQPSSAAPDPLLLAVIGSLAAFRGLPLYLPDGQELDLVLGGEPFTRVEHRLSDPAASPLVASVIEVEDWRSLTRFWRRSAAVRTVLLYLLTPDPLSELVRQVVGEPAEARL